MVLNPGMPARRALAIADECIDEMGDSDPLEAARLYTLRPPE